MPAICTTHELIERITTPEPLSPQPLVHGKALHALHALVHKVTSYLAYTPRAQYIPVGGSALTCEAPIDRLVREHPALSCYALAMV